MPISLNDYASLIDDQMTAGLFRNMQRMNDVLKIFPVTSVKTWVVRGVLYDELPEGQFRDLNDTYEEDTGTVRPVEDRVAIFGGSFSEDEAFGVVNDPTMLRDPVELQFDMWAKAIERGLMDTTINGSIATDPKSYEGLWRRLNNTDYIASGQIVNVSPGAGAELHVLASAANAQTFFDGLDEAIYKAGLGLAAPPTGQPAGALLMNETSLLGMQKAAKLSGWNINQVDLLGWTFREYMNLPMVDVGKKRDRTTDIILDTYDPGDGGSDSSRIYVVRFAAPDGVIESPGSDGLTVISAGGLRRLGPIKSLTSDLWGLEWILGLSTIGDDYCISCLNGFEMAAS